MLPVAIQSTSTLSDTQKRVIFQLWNEEYPAQLAYGDLSELDSYLNKLTSQQHYFALHEESIAGWAFVFMREQETWFAIIVSGKYHNNEIGSQLLNSLKESYNELNGWVADHNNDVKANKEVYPSPLDFYIKHGFKVCHDIRLETEKLSAVKIKWNNSSH